MFAVRNTNTSSMFVARALDNLDRKFEYPQWGANLNVFMDAAIDSET